MNQANNQFTGGSLPQDNISSHLEWMLQEGTLSIFEIRADEDRFTVFGRNIVRSFFGVDADMYETTLSHYINDLCHPDDRALLRASLAVINAGGDTGGAFSRTLNHKGEWRWAHTYSTKLSTILSGKTIVRGCVVDATDQLAVQAKSDTYTRRLEAMIEAIPLATILISKNDGLIDCNMNAVKLGQFTVKKDFIAQYNTLLAEFQPDGRRSIDVYLEMRNLAFETGGGFYPFTYTLPNGTTIPGEITLRRIDWDGEDLLLGVFRDLTQLTAEREKAKEAEEYNQLMLDATPLACILVDDNVRTIACNATAVELLGFESKEDLYENYASCLPEFQPDGTSTKILTLAMRRRALDVGELEYELTYCTQSGEVIPTHVILKRVEWHNGHRILGYVQDMREILAANKAMHEAQRLTSVMLDRVPLSCFVFNENGEILECNDRAVSLYGARDKKELCENIFTKFSPAFQSDGRSSAQAGKEYINNSFGELEAFFEFEHRHASGEAIPTEIILHTIQWDDGERRMLAYGRDLRALKTSMAAIEAQQRELIEARDLALASERSKTAFLANMSHEIRTPMTAIIGMTSIARQSQDVDKMEYCLDKVADASEHLLGVINDILDISKIEAGRFILSNSDFSVEHMLQRITDMMTFRVDQKHQNFIIKVDNDIPKVIVSDQQRLTQVIMNLLSNANKFTPDHGDIIMRVGLAEPVGEATRDYKLLFQVIDTGIGIEPDSIERLFDSFEQGDNSISRRFGGTGLGLSISKTIVDQMDGEIWVESVLGEGSTFSFTIQTRQGIAYAVDRIDPTIDVRNVNIMVVDDSPVVLEYFTDIISNIGIPCRTAQTGAEAFELIEEKKPDIMFIDWLMPEMDGIELTRQIRRRYDDSVVIIMISAMDWTQVESEARSVGIDRFIAKPLLPSPIIDCINECLGSTASNGGILEDKPLSDYFTGKRVLMAEDVKINSEIVIAMMEGTGLEIVCAENGRVAYEIFANDPLSFDLILMDVHMPEVDGYEATRKIREMPYQKAKDIPIVALTANVFKEDVEKCLAAGMNDHLAKPFDFKQFNKTLVKYLA